MTRKRFLSFVSAFALLLSLSGCCLLFKQQACTVPEPPACCAGDLDLVGVEYGVVYRGLLPCADCPGIEWALELQADNVYYLRTGYLERGANGGPAVFDEIGRFEVRAELNEVQLLGRGGVQRFAMIGLDTLRKLDAHGMTIESALNYDLVKQTDAPRLEPVVVLVGMYSYQADAGRFRDCRTGRESAVAQEADNAELERRYTAARKKAGEWLLVSFEGRLVERAKAEESGREHAVVVEHFVNIWPDDTCGAHESTAALVNTFWALTWVEGFPLREPKPDKEIHLMLEPSSGRARGFAGCNQFSGTYELSGASLKLGALLSTKLSCAEVQALEDRYLQALGRVAAWKIYGEQLELYDAGHELLARFESRYLQ